ncbi:Ces3 (predicted), partial [Pycnogonum litorale]
NVRGDLVQYSVHRAATFVQLSQSQSINHDHRHAVLKDIHSRFIFSRRDGMMDVSLRSIFVPVFLILLDGFSCLQQSPRTVKTKYGSLRGEIISFTDSQPVEQFLGIPYASPPVGELRFMPPVTTSMWDGVRDANTFGPVCPQNFPDISDKQKALLKIPLGRYEYLKRLEQYLHHQREDCLYLNIYVPELVQITEVKLPVMVFIHGESHEWNSGNPYNGSVLASVGNVVVVTINYRLGVLGFLTTNDETARGNYGIFDQVAALHWIEQNIGNIGGDTSNITIIGHGSGAAFVHILMLSPVAKGLFHRAIMQSGAASSAMTMTSNPMEQMMILAKYIGCSSGNNKAIIKCLRKQNARSLLDAARSLDLPGIKFGPTVDGVAVPRRVEALMKGNVYNYGKLQLLIGVTRAEYYVNFGAEDVQLGIDEKKRYDIVHSYIKNTLHVNTAAITAVALNEYTDWTTSIQHPINLLDAAADLLGDAHRVAPVVGAARHHTRLKQKTFMYVFGYQTKSGDYSDRLGCVHGEDLPYVFGAPLVQDRRLSHFSSNFTPSERSLSHMVIHYWSNFAYTGDPNRNSWSHDNSRGENSRKMMWPKYESTQQRYLNIGMRPKVRNHYRAHKLSLWLELIPQLSRIVSFQTDKGIIPTSDEVTSTVLPSTTGLSETRDSSPPDRSPEVTIIPTTYGPINVNINSSMPGRNGDRNNSTYLRILHTTIAVGTVLLVINVVVFTATLYQKRTRRRYNDIDYDGRDKRRRS